VDPSLVKGNEGMQQYSPIVFQDKKRKDSKGEKLDFPSTTKQLELKDVKQPEFPSTPFTGEAYSQSFHNPRPSNSVKDGTHVSVQGDGPVPQQAGPFRGEHGPDVQFKGSDYVPKRTKKSIMIAGRKVLIKGSEGSDNSNLRDYPIDKGESGRGFGDDTEAQKRKDWSRSGKVKEDVKAHEQAKRNYAPGNGPFDLAMDTRTAYLGRGKDSKPIGEYTKDYPGAKVTFNQPIDPTKKPKKVLVHLTEGARDVKAKRQTSRADAADKIGMKYDEGNKTLTKKSANGIMRVILQYTQNQPLAAGFKPLLAHLVTNDDDDEENLKGPKLAKKAMSSSDVYDRISSTRDKNKPISPKLQKLGSRAAKVAEDSGGTQAHDDAAPAHPGVDYKALNPKSVASLDDYKQHRRNMGTLKEKGPPAQNEPFDALVGSEGESVDFPRGLDKPAKVLEFKKKEPKSALTDPRDTNMMSGKSEEARPLQLKSPFREASPDDNKKLAYLAAERKQLDERSSNLSKKQLSLKSSRPNPIEGGKGDDLEYKDVDENELEAGIEVEQEHVGKDPDKDEDEKRLDGADIAMDHLAEDEHYYTKLKEMERQGKEGAKSETKKEKLLKLGEATEKSVIKERKLAGTVANAEKMARIRQETNASPSEMKATHGQLRAYTAKLKAERKKNESVTKAKIFRNPTQEENFRSNRPFGGNEQTRKKKADEAAASRRRENASAFTEKMMSRIRTDPTHRKLDPTGGYGDFND
jgi:hypothetical protein